MKTYKHTKDQRRYVYKNGLINIGAKFETKIHTFCFMIWVICNEPH